MAAANTIRVRRRSGDLLPPSPPAEKATTRHQTEKAKFSHPHPQLKKVASLHCGSVMSKGNSRANGISGRESTNQPDCENDQNVHHSSRFVGQTIGAAYRAPSGSRFAQAVRHQPRRPPRSGRKGQHQQWDGDAGLNRFRSALLLIWLKFSRACPLPLSMRENQGSAAKPGDQREIALLARGVAY